MKLFMTIDLEDWYNAHDYAISRDFWNECESRIEKNTRRLLDILSKYQVKAVFFVLGYIADRHPSLVKEIADRGHVIASHGYWHYKLYELTREELSMDVKESLQKLEDLSGKKVRFFRAPSWTYDKRSEYLHEVLMEEGIQVDSSLQPFRTPLSGVRGAPLEPFYPIVSQRQSSVLEFPVPVCKLGPLRIPFCGGFYFRVMPYWFIKHCLKKTLMQHDCFVYIHPWEIDREQPKPKAPLYIKLIHNYGIKNTGRKLEKLLNEFSFSHPESFGVGDVINGECAYR